ncbi:MAG: alkyl hydroperoxide reductase [Cytophagales bacterium CG18_big_fil_WC_8_21_14_2_50_42_9]|nr:MAG: alkyl hydroperoxide reductase [Cytophagales bacterium CG18_big_fil_WC_8_21_14_2_50_42_9]
MAVLVGKKAPSFKATAVINGEEFEENFSLDQYIGKQYVVFFFWPFDFTFVCPTEIIAFQDRIADFEKRNVAVVGCSTDSHFAHFAWLNTPKDQGGIQGITFPLVADTSKTIATNYDVLAGEYTYNEEGEMVFNGEPAAYRGLFLIDKEGLVRHQLINDMPLGRSVEEAIRMVDALQHFEEKGEVCPANWEQGKDAMQATREGVSNYLANH